MWGEMQPTVTRPLDARPPVARVAGDEVDGASPGCAARRARQQISYGKGTSGHRLYQWALLHLHHGKALLLGVQADAGGSRCYRAYPMPLEC
jgi:hypothetical protein